MAEDTPRAAAISRALMRGADWAQQHPVETAQLMVAKLAGAGEYVDAESMQRALSLMAFVPRAESARPVLEDQFSRYLTYGLPVQPRMSASSIVDRVYVPVTDELAT